MKNKILIELVVPILEKSYDVYIPVNRKVGNTIELLQKSISEMSGGYFKETSQTALYSSLTGDRYPIDIQIRATDIRNGSRVILM